MYAKATQGRGIVDAVYVGRSVRPTPPESVSGRRITCSTTGWTASPRRFVSTVRRHGGFMGHLPPAVDVECLRALGPRIPTYAAHQLRAFLGEVFEETGRMAVIYTSPYMWHQVTGTTGRSADTRCGWRAGIVHGRRCRVAGAPGRTGRSARSASLVSGWTAMCSRRSTTLRRSRTATPHIGGHSRYVRRASVRMKPPRSGRQVVPEQHRWPSLDTLATVLGGRDIRPSCQGRPPTSVPPFASCWHSMPVTSDRVTPDRTAPSSAWRHPASLWDRSAADGYQAPSRGGRAIGPQGSGPPVSRGRVVAATRRSSRERGAAIGKLDTRLARAGSDL